MLEAYLVPENTTVTEKGDGPPVDISAAGSRVFLLNLKITAIVEQESLDVAILGSPDGSAWGQKPIATFPQKFYRGEHPLLHDLSAQPDAKFLRAHWEVSRWGRGDTKPMFEFSVKLSEVPAEVLKETAAALSKA
jgi:hypothetical protein